MRIEPTYCGLTKGLYRDCQRPAMPDSPIPLCEKHMREAYLHFANHIEALWDTLEEDPLAWSKRVFRPHTEGPDRPVVYYMLIGHHVKIGTTRNLSARLTQLMPDELLATEPGGLELEKERHVQFAQWRDKGREYFLPGPDLRAHIESLGASA